MNYRLLSKTKRNWLAVLLMWFFVSFVVLLIVDTVLSPLIPEQVWFDTKDGIALAAPERHTEYEIQSISDSMQNQTIWLSVWCEATLGIFGLLNFIAIFSPKMGKWVSSKQNWTFVLSIQTLLFLIWCPWSVQQMISGSFFSQHIYKWLKALIAHWINPIVLCIMYFIFAKDVVLENKYAKSSAWYVLIFMSVYMAYVLAREGLMKAHPELFSLAMKRYPIPYWQFVNPISFSDPYEPKPAVPVWQWVSILIALEILPYAIECFWNEMSNIAIRNSKKKTYLWRTN